MKALRRLVSYMQGIVSEGILISNRGRRAGLLGNSDAEAWIESDTEEHQRRVHMCVWAMFCAPPHAANV